MKAFLIASEATRHGGSVKLLFYMYRAIFSYTRLPYLCGHEMEIRIGEGFAIKLKIYLRMRSGWHAMGLALSISTERKC